MKQAIFQNADLQREFDKEGVVSINFLTQEEIEILKTLFFSVPPALNEMKKPGFYFSTGDESTGQSRKVFDILLPFFQPRLSRVFKEFKVLTIVAQVKYPGDDSAVGLHQDLTVVDEDKYSSITFWLPLVDSTIENGALHFLKRSQQVFRSFRAHMCNYLFAQVEGFVKLSSTVYTAKAGEAILFDPATIHFSPPNTTADPRPSIAISIVSEAAPVILGYFDNKSSSDSIEVYDVPDNFWYLYEKFNTEREQRPRFGKLNENIGHKATKEYELKSFVEKYEQLISQP